MLKSPKSITKKAASASRLVAVIKSSLAEQEMDEADEHRTNHQGPYMTAAKTLVYAAERDTKRAANAP